VPALGWNQDQRAPWARLGLVRLGMGDLPGAREALERHVAICDCFPMHLYLGEVRRLQGDFGPASAAFRRALERQPGWNETRYWLAFSLLGEGRYDLARERFEEFFSRHDGPAGWRVPPEGRRTVVEEYVELTADLPRHLRDLGAGLEPGTRVRLARLCRELGHVVESARIYVSVFAEHPDAARIPMSAALARHAAGDAAHSFVWAGLGRGEGGDRVRREARRRWRDRARALFRRELRIWRERIEAGETRLLPSAKALADRWASRRHARRGMEFAQVRERSNLRLLPPGEADEWRELWEEVRSFAAWAESASGK